MRTDTVKLMVALRNFAKRLKTTNQPCVTTQNIEDLNYTQTEARNHTSFCSQHITERKCDDLNKRVKFEVA